MPIKCKHLHDFTFLSLDSFVIVFRLKFLCSTFLCAAVGGCRGEQPNPILVLWPFNPCGSKKNILLT